MNSVNVLQAMSSLSNLVEAIEEGWEREIVIARDGRPVAKLVPVETSMMELQIGAIHGAFDLPEDIHASSEEVARSFFGEPQSASAYPH